MRDRGKNRAIAAKLWQESLEKQNRSQMNQVFSVSSHSSTGGFAFQGFYSEAPSPNRRSRSDLTPLPLAGLRRGLRMRRLVLLVLFSLCVWSQLSFADSAPIKVERAWVQAVPEVSDTTAAYMKIINLSSNPLKVTGASSPAAKTVEPMITTRKTHGGQEIMGMQSVNELVIPAGGSLELKPGGDHLMIMGLNLHPREGEVIKLTIRFAPGDQKFDLEVPVCKEEPK